MKARVHLGSKGPLKATHLAIKWLDDQGAEIGRVNHRFRYPWWRDWMNLYAEVPDAARYGRLELVRWGERPVNVGPAELEFLQEH